MWVMYIQMNSEIFLQPLAYQKKAVHQHRPHHLMKIICLQAAWNGPLTKCHPPSTSQDVVKEKPQSNNDKRCRCAQPPGVLGLRI